MYNIWEYERERESRIFIYILSKTLIFTNSMVKSKHLFTTDYPSKSEMRFLIWDNPKKENENPNLA